MIKKVLKALFWTFVDLVFLPIHYLPGQIASRVLRPLFWKLRLRKLGHGCVIGIGVKFLHPENISIGDNTWIDNYVILLAGKPTYGKRKIYHRLNQSYTGREGDLSIGVNCHIAPYVLISAHGGVTIGNNLTIASGSKVYSFSHHYRNLLDKSDKSPYKFTSMAPQEEQALISGPVIIEDNAAIGLNTVVLPGVTVGRNTWVGVQSVVKNDIPPDVIAAGNPCEILKSREG